MEEGRQADRQVDTLNGKMLVDKQLVKFLRQADRQAGSLAGRKTDRADKLTVRQVN